MVAEGHCPDPAKIAAYAASQTTVAHAESLDRHLAECRACLDRFLELGRRSAAPEIPECHVVREVGRGRFGVVYKAWWTKGPPRLVALKLLSSPGDMERHRFEREIGVLKKLDSPWIVKCLESGATADGMYFVMDFVAGVHLDDYLGDPGRNLNQKLAVLQRVCRAVADAHGAGVVHRDLKPGNILIDDHGEPHILDFGICSVNQNQWSSWARQTITHPGDVIGTLRYMSPEQAWGGAAGPVDERSDIWALGIMLYQIVTNGGYPYSQDSLPGKTIHEALLERIRNQLPLLPKLDSLPRGRDLQVLLERCLAREPEHRFGSAAALSADLDRYIEGRRIETRPLRIRHRVKRRMVWAATQYRNRYSIAFTALSVLMVLAAAFQFQVGWRVTGTAYQSPGAPGAPTFPEDPRTAMAIVGIREQSFSAVEEFARARSIATVSSDVKTWRPVHGAWMERLAAARPRLLIWDYYFATTREGDEAFVGGLETLEAAGTPVILAVADFDDHGAPVLSTSLTERLGPRLRYGAIEAREMVAHSGQFLTAIRRDNGTVIPGLGLTALVAFLHPEANLEIDWSDRSLGIELLYRVGPRAYLRERDRVEVSKVFQQGDASRATRAGDVLAFSTLRLEPSERWTERILAYETLLNASDEQLKELTSNRILIVGDLRESRSGFQGDWHPVRYGPRTVQDVPGCYLLADAVAGLLERGYVVAGFPPPPTTYLILLASAAVGCWVPRRLAGRGLVVGQRSIRPLWLALTFALAGGLALAEVGDQFVTVHLGLAAATICLPLAGSLWVEYARNRHWLAGAQPQDANPRFFDAKRTLTLPSKRRKERPAA